MSSIDPYSDPDTGVLINKFGLSDEAALRAVETDVAALRDTELRRLPLPGSFDLKHLCGIHRFLFGDIYPWAGQRRTVLISRTSPFAAPEHIESSADGLFRKLRAERLLVNLDRTSFLARFAYYFGEVNALHPFREGNGRAQRAFFRQLALQAGWHVEFDVIAKEPFYEACRQSMVDSDDLLRELFDAALTRVG